MKKLNEGLLLRITILITLILFSLIYYLLSFLSESVFFRITISFIVSVVLYETVGAVIWGIFSTEKEVEKDVHDRN